MEALSVKMVVNDYNHTLKKKHPLIEVPMSIDTLKIMNIINFTIMNYVFVETMVGCPNTGLYERIGFMLQAAPYNLNFDFIWNRVSFGHYKHSYHGRSRVLFFLLSTMMGAYQIDTVLYYNML